MAVTFFDLHTEADIKSLKEFLARKSYTSGDQVTKDDSKVYATLPEDPSADLYPNASKWYQTVSYKLAPRLPGKAAGVGSGSKNAPAKEAQVAGDDDDDIDLFSEETEEEKKAAEERAAATKASSKEKESGKSSVLLDVKPWDDETEMKKLEEAVRSIDGGTSLGSIKTGCRWIRNQEVVDHDDHS